MYPDLPVREDVFQKIVEFLKEIDKPGAILAMYDEGKVFARCEWLNYEAIYEKMLLYIFKETKYIKIRVGGYSHRVRSMVYDLIENNPSFKERVERINVGELSFDKESEFIKRADKYDFKGIGGHSCVYYYVNGIDSGFYDKDGKFCHFYQANSKGQDAITEVVMAIGYGDIPPATAAVHTFTFDSPGDMLICGGQVTKKKCRGQSRQDLFEENNIPYLDIHKILPPDKELHEDLLKI